ncbi:hypothetical protein BD309DRAFT_469022 [Dichomitus squalens]|nr:hypothetical protein BD309DRAFT_469022 [Dichomitus squalens]
MRRCPEGAHSVQKDDEDGRESPVRALLSLWLRMNMEIPTIARTDARPPPSAHPPSPNARKPIVFAFLLRSLRGRPTVLNVSPLISHTLTHNMADADSSITDPSLAPSSSTTHIVSESLNNLVPNPDSEHPSDRAAKSDRRASLGLIDAARMRLSLDVRSEHAPVPSERRA